MARKLPVFRRELHARSLFSVAYGEVASSIYFALGVIALHAVGFTPLLLLGVGLLFLLVSFSYAEGTSALAETGGAATFVRRALNDFAGFMTGWALFLDYLIVMALSALFLPLGSVVTVYVAIAAVALSAFPGPRTELGTRWLRAPLVGVATQIRAHMGEPWGDILRFFVGASGALILLAAMTTSISGFSR